MERTKALRIARGYVKKLKENNLPIDRAYLFGSYARNKQHKDSDIDICLVVDNFRSDKLWRIWNKAGALKNFEDELPIETVVVTKGEFRKWNPLPGAVMKEGIKIST